VEVEWISKELAQTHDAGWCFDREILVESESMVVSYSFYADTGLYVHKICARCRISFVFYAVMDAGATGPQGGSGD
jgi:hypothetical protein